MFFSDELNQKNPLEIEGIRSFLKKFNIDYDFPEKTYVIRDKGAIVATGSVNGNILKYLFVDCDYSGQGVIGVIYNSLLDYIIKNGYKSYFIFTSPNNKIIFQSLGLNEVISTRDVTLLEGGFYNYDKWMEGIREVVGEKIGKRGAIVVNCNPMTLGHKYLITEALKHVDDLLIFVVEEDASIFSFEDRYNILVSEFKNERKVKVLKGGPYIISKGTFPTYFIKQKDKMLQIYTELDAKIFAEKIASNLEIEIRFLGSEPLDIVTNAYNSSLEQILNGSGIGVRIIPRIESGEDPISASFVRQLLNEDRLEEAYKLLPESTIEFLKSEKGRDIINKIKSL